jgi:hypothetical protein
VLDSAILSSRREAGFGFDDVVVGRGREPLPGARSAGGRAFGERAVDARPLGAADSATFGLGTEIVGRDARLGSSLTLEPDHARV